VATTEQLHGTHNSHACGEKGFNLATVRVQAVLVAIVCSTMLLCIEDPLADSVPPIMVVLDYLFSSFFICECAFKVILLPSSPRLSTPRLPPWTPRALAFSSPGSPPYNHIVTTQSAGSGSPLCI